MKNVKKVWRACRFKFVPDVELIRWYYGEELGLYFAWVSYLTLWMIAPAALAVVTWAATKFSGRALDILKSQALSPEQANKTNTCR